ncbi:MAG: inositol monophosphatase family protein [Candidatus Hadarchaeales archaeon]
MSELENVIPLVLRAGEVLREGFRRSGFLGMRGTAKGLTTPYDLESDRVLVEGLSSSYPDHNLLTEETGLVERGSEFTWVVDPLDGTTNFASGNPLFCITLALLRRGEPILGITFLPVLQELFLAERGKGAFLERRETGERIPIHVSGVEELERAYVYSCEGSETNRERTGKIVCTLYPRVRDLRKLGSAGVEAAWVACGKGDAYAATALQPWDVAASVLLVEEAGGKVTDFRGGRWRPERMDLLFSNGKLHSQLLGLLEGL